MFASMVSGTPLKNFISLTEPLGLPSALAPLSERATIRVFSSCPVSSRKSRIRPIWASV
ncbi:hypothetical protein D3C86_2221730 [compost metagenome]